ncbi:MAG: hypothetical protein WBB31_00890 [Saprospiraceae bacterium]
MKGKIRSIDHFSERSERNSLTDSSSILDISFTTSGMLVPRMSIVQRIAIPNPANGLLVYDTGVNAFYFSSGTALKKMSFE